MIRNVPRHCLHRNHFPRVSKRKDPFSSPLESIQRVYLNPCASTFQNATILVVTCYNWNAAQKQKSSDTYTDLLTITSLNSVSKWNDFFCNCLCRNHLYFHEYRKKNLNIIDLMCLRRLSRTLYFWMNSRQLQFRWQFYIFCSCSHRLVFLISVLCYSSQL